MQTIIKKTIRHGIVSAFVMFPALVFGQQASDGIGPEYGTGILKRQAVKAANHMVATANPLATKVGSDILLAGGNAIDAMVAVQLVLGLTEPQSSGIGGGAFLVYFDSTENRLTTFDGRETAPTAATPLYLHGNDGEPLEFYDAVVGGLSVGTPGTPKLIYEVHAKHGSMDWAKLVQPAIDLAEQGFEISERLARMLEYDREFLAVHKQTAEYFLQDDGTPHPVGHLLKNPAYAQTLKMIAENGADAFYQGPVAEGIINAVKNDNPANPGLLELEDLANYRMKERPPVCMMYRGYDICGMGPPSSGALTVGQILGILEPFDMAARSPADPETWQLIGDASRLAFADRGRYMADVDFVPMPTKGLLDRSYLDERASLLTPGNALSPDDVKPGSPDWDHAILLADDDSIELPSTSHFAIVDSKRNVVSMTTTIENNFGSRVMSGGFLLNNELTDFSFRSHIDGFPIANRVEPGKRPRSSMSPTIIMKDGKPYMAVGSPGGSRIIGYVTQAIIAHLDWGLDVQSAINMPQLVNRFGPFDLEKGTEAEKLAPALEQMGFSVEIRDLNSGLHGIQITESGLIGGADPRREGNVLGN